MRYTKEEIKAILEENEEKRPCSKCQRAFSHGSCIAGPCGCSCSFNHKSFELKKGIK